MGFQPTDPATVSSAAAVTTDTPVFGGYTIQRSPYVGLEFQSSLEPQGCLGGRHQLAADLERGGPQRLFRGRLLSEPSGDSLNGP
jgi:hypothetical protein